MSAGPLTVGIIQSSYIPWRGYFDFIDDVDLFIFLEDVIYSHGTWRNRNQIKTPQGLLWLTVPVHHDSQSLIQDVEIDYRHRWVDKHIGSLRQHYSRAPHFSQYSQPVFDTLASRPRTLSALNITLIQHFMSILGIETKTRLSSELPAAGQRDERLLNLLRAAHATHYLSGPTAKAYIEPKRFQDGLIGLSYKTYEYSKYPQLYGQFQSQVTVLDLVFNCGAESRNHLKSRTRNEEVVRVE